MKLSKKAFAVLSTLALMSALFADSFVHSKHAAIPDTSSKIVTKAQDINGKLTAIELTKMMGNGINLGNTMEAHRSGDMGTKQAATDYEQLWGQPVTTENMIKGYKAAGFDTIRIPVAWTNAIDFENGDYTINTAYLDRIETLVNYALKADMFVIINDHWDGSWWGLFGQKDEAYRKDAAELYTAMWTQIGNRFKNYSYKLIFEGANEEVGDRLNDATTMWKKGSLTENGCYTMANYINQLFVDTIRSLGGNNKKRFLLIPGYNTDINKTCDSRYKMPTDSVKNRLLISVHYYDPSDFCIGGGDLWGTKADYEYQNEQLKKMTKFTDQGIGVIIGEYGALVNNGTYKTSTLAWTSNVLDNCDLYNYVPVLWDTGSGCFYSKEKCKLIYDELAKLYSGRTAAKEGKYKDVQAAAEKNLTATVNNAKDSLFDNGLSGRKDIGIAYLMYSDAGWSQTYSVGDEYKPESKSKGLEAVDAEITGPGEYTVSLDFTGTQAGSASGFAFSAIGIENGEALFPGYAIEVKEILVNGKPVKNIKKGYTTSDNGETTRINLVNDWVSSIPDGIRSYDGKTNDVTAVMLDKTDSIFNGMKTISVKFAFAPAK